MDSTSSERDPLLPSVISSGAVQDIGTHVVTEPKTKQGPLELSTSTKCGILAGLWLANLLASVNMTLVATLMSSISSEFNKSQQASWLGTAYLLANCTFTPLYGRLCNVMGRRGANQTAVFLTGFGALACGLAPTMEMLILARFLGGMGGGGVFTTTTIITSDMFSLRSRGLAQGVSSVFNGLGMGLGGPIGGFISDTFGWRWAFLIQAPFFLLSFCLTGYNLRYATPGKGRNPREVLKRIDYGGSTTLLVTVLAILIFLSNRYNEGLRWRDVHVIAPLIIGVVFGIAFVVVELRIAPEPVLAPFLLKQKIPVLVGVSNFLVALCNFSVMYFFPMWFQTVMVTSASTAGLHILPNSISMSTGSLFAGWVMHSTGKYKLLNTVFGIFPFIAMVLIATMNEHSSAAQQWLSIIPLGFGNAIVLQTMLIALLAHIPQSVMAVGTGFGQLFRGLGQVSGVAISSAIFQSILDHELWKRIHTPDAAEMIKKIRESATLVGSLPPGLQRAARDSYAIALRAVFTMAACATLCAYIVRLLIPDKDLDDQPPATERNQLVASSSTSPVESLTETPVDSENEDGQVNERTPVLRTRTSLQYLHRPRRLSAFESQDGMLDLESDTIGKSARSL